MSIDSVRFRSEGGLIVLQVLEATERGAPYHNDRTAAWRDAKVEDLLNVSASPRHFSIHDRHEELS